MHCRGHTVHVLEEVKPPGLLCCVERCAHSTCQKSASWVCVCVQSTLFAELSLSLCFWLIYYKPELAYGPSMAGATPPFGFLVCDDKSPQEFNQNEDQL